MSARPEAITIGQHEKRRVHEQTALDDHDVVLDAGVYPLRYVAIDGRNAKPEAAYWALASIPCARLHDGVRFGKAGKGASVEGMASAQGTKPRPPGGMKSAPRKSRTAASRGVNAGPSRAANTLKPCGCFTMTW